MQEKLRLKGTIGQEGGETDFLSVCVGEGGLGSGETRYVHPTSVLRKITGRTSPAEWKSGRLGSQPTRR